MKKSTMQVFGLMLSLVLLGGYKIGNQWQPALDTKYSVSAMQADFHQLPDSDRKKSSGSL